MMKFRRRQLLPVWDTNRCWAPALRNYLRDCKVCPALSFSVLISFYLHTILSLSAGSRVSLSVYILLYLSLSLPLSVCLPCFSLSSVLFLLVLLCSFNFTISLSLSSVCLSVCLSACLSCLLTSGLFLLSPALSSLSLCFFVFFSIL